MAMISLRTMNLPNLITMIRILLVPVFVIFLLNHMFLAAIILFTIAGISDGIDGLLARTLDQRTQMGAYLDPMADKVMMTASFVCLAAMDILPPWLAVIVISRDLIIVFGIALCFIAERKVEITPSPAGKIATTAQILTVFIVLVFHEIPWSVFDRYGIFLYYLTALITVVSGLQYVYIGLNTPPKNPADPKTAE